MIDSNGHISKPVNGSLSIGEVARFLNVPKRSDNKYYLSDVCKAPAINPWSRKKPVRSTKRAQITDSDVIEANFGFDLTSVAAYSAADCIDNAKSNAGAWTYLRPRGRSVSPTEMFRLLDFDGYHHDAEVPYDFEHPTSTSIKGNKSVSIHQLTSAEIKIEDISGDALEYFDPSTAHIVLIWRIAGTNTLHFIRSNDTVENEFDNSPYYTFTVPMNANATYEMVVAASDWDGVSDTDEFMWLYFPTGYGETVVNDQANIFIVVLDGSHSDPFSATHDVQQDLVSIQEHLYLSNEIGSNTTATDISVTTVISYISDGAHVTLGSATHYQADMDYGEDELATLALSNVPVYDVPYSSDVFSSIYIATSYSYKENGTGATITRYIDYSNNTTDSSPVAPVPVRSVLNNY